MAKVKVTTRFKIIELIDRFVDGAFARDLGNTIVSEVKDLIRTGQSPVREYGRFERYKDRFKYPGDLKSARPVNLQLRGLMLDDYKHVQKDDTTIEVGVLGNSTYANGATTKEVAGYHNDGTPKMAQRRIVPGDGEEFAISVMRAIREKYGKRLEKLIKDSNR